MTASVIWFNMASPYFIQHGYRAVGRGRRGRGGLITPVYFPVSLLGRVSEEREHTSSCQTCPGPSAHAVAASRNEEPAGGESGVGLEGCKRWGHGRISALTAPITACKPRGPVE